MLSHLTLMLLPLTGLAVFLYTPVQGAGHRKICYYTNWSQYRPGLGKYTPENVDAQLCTHYMYAFATLLGNKVKAYEWNDLSTQWMKGMFARFMDLKNINPGIKTLLAVGGWNLGSGPFHQMSHTPSGRKEFADSCVKFLRDHNFDGVDIDWEYPANRGSPPEDKNHFTELLQTVHDTFEAESQRTGRPRLMLTAAVAAGKTNIDTAYDIPAISRLLDFISVMAYDLHGSWEDHTGHNSPLYARASETGDDRFLNLNWAADHWVQKGAPRDKLNIGVALYGRTFTLSGPDNRLGASARGPGDAGPYTREKGFLSYQEICEMERNGGQIVEIPEQRVRYITRGNQWVGYDDEKSLREKVCYIKSHGYGGVMVWALDLDDFSGSDCNKGRYPLLNAVVQELDSPDKSNCVGPGQAPVTAQPVHTTPRPVTQTPYGIVTNPPYITTAQPSRTIAPCANSNCFNCYGKTSDFYASPYSCEEYFICANGMSFKVECAAGLRFNPHTKYCDRAANVACSLSPVQTPKPVVVTTPIPIQPTTPYVHFVTQPVTPKPFTPKQTTWNPTSTVNDYCRGKSNGLYRDPHTCSKYYQCYMQLGFERVCAPNLAFNDRIQACDFPYRVPGC